MFSRACLCAGTAGSRARRTDGVFTVSTRFLRVATPARRGSEIMRTFHQSGVKLCSGVACLCLCAASVAPAQAQTDTNAPLNDASTCRFVVGQTEIDGVIQQVGGRACLQPDGSWQIVEDDAGAPARWPSARLRCITTIHGTGGRRCFSVPVCRSYSSTASIIFITWIMCVMATDRMEWGRAETGMAARPCTCGAACRAAAWVAVACIASLPSPACVSARETP
jgi:hypothetical protein